MANEYFDYLQSAAWFATTMEAKERARWRCEVCGRKNVPLHTHHRTYDRVGREQPQDLVVLCEIHHAEVHGGCALPPPPQRALPFVGDETADDVD